ncbi:hypothetical protein FRB99_000939 [Tulasnella sp. 403]|nr:hypothetical protein FRB99_000939 [Tulasnella sp. 403]
MFAKVVALAALSAPLASAAIIDVFVGGTGILKFTPESVTANVGDSVRFTFGPKNHTVTQSSFANPCAPLAGGFFSGYMPVAATQTTGMPQFYIPVTDTKPIWAFCSQTGHCKQGMVFAINAPPAPAANSFDNFKAAAMGGAVAQPGVSQPAVTSSAAPVTTSAAVVADPYGGGYGGGANPTGAVPTTLPAVTTSAAPSQATVPSNAAGGGTVHKIVVGGSAGLVYTPNNIQAAVGDVIQFEFQVKNHTVTQSTFKDPCTPSAPGFDSGYMPVAASDTTFPTWSFTVNDTKPIWGYCKQGNHCQSGMVFAINANESSANNFAAFQAAAKASTPGSSNSNSSTPITNGAASAFGSVEAGSWKLMLGTVAMVSLGFSLVL